MTSKVLLKKVGFFQIRYSEIHMMISGYLRILLKSQDIVYPAQPHFPKHFGLNPWKLFQPFNYISASISSVGFFKKKCYEE